MTENKMYEIAEDAIMPAEVREALAADLDAAGAQDILAEAAAQTLDIARDALKAAQADEAQADTNYSAILRHKDRADRRLRSLMVRNGLIRTAEGIRRATWAELPEDRRQVVSGYHVASSTEGYFVMHDTDGIVAGPMGEASSAAVHCAGLIREFGETWDQV